ncbi:OmpA family protein [Winogradskyella sp.]|nr:OmpA family protein [Winogradskyella sp.]
MKNTNLFLIPKIILDIKTMFCLAFIFTISTVSAQDETTFSFTAGTNIIDNSNGTDSPWDVDRFEFKNPFFIEAEFRRKNWGLAFMATTNNFELTRLNEAGDGFVVNSYDFFSLNITNKFYIDHYYFDTKSVDIYVGVGFGYHDIAEGKAMTANLSLGFNYWFTDALGVSLQAIGNKRIVNEVLYVGNYYQYNLGVSYRIKAKKKRVQPEEVKASEAENEEAEIKVEEVDEIVPVAEVITATPNLEDKDLKTQDADAESSIQKTAQDILTDEIEAIGPVYFEKNSSYFGASEKSKLNRIVNLLKDNKEITIRLDSYTDASGTDAYNKYLSDRRLDRVTKHLINRGFKVSMVKGVSHGVDTNNSCNAEHTSCTEQEHAKQRRVEITIEK